MNLMILIPNFLTACNLLAGLAGMSMAFQGNVATACWLIIASVLFDGVDGKIASWLELESEFGRWFDSLADWTAFGVLPAVIVIFSVHNSHSFWLWAVATFYALSALFRLIRFNFESKHSETGDKLFFRGLPTTASAAFFAGVHLTFPFHEAPEMFQIALMLGLAVLMMSDVRYYNPRILFTTPGNWRLLSIGGLAALLFASFYVPAIIFYFFAIYILSGIANLHERFAVPALSDSDDSD